jgi:hypothetical protein
MCAQHLVHLLGETDEAEEYFKDGTKMGTTLHDELPYGLLFCGLVRDSGRVHLSFQIGVLSTAFVEEGDEEGKSEGHDRGDDAGTAKTAGTPVLWRFLLSER